ncbi:GNAT family N-acetyltransferase [Mucilaginibacter sp.]|uniref:GNAT family N-acetyltransferase n=1 Tax=Mucilaginibacter sp. TaxID=1882438 RepID=UPI00261072FF|nr:GNAT family N-acetyltransferase [Mucilaginibacter sp.]
MSQIEILQLTYTPQIRSALSELLIETVADGSSVTFMHPLSLTMANDFWTESLMAADKGERIVLGAYDGEALVGTVTLLLNCPQNQPHRAEIAKMMTRISHRDRGIAKALMQTAEQLAIKKQRTLLVLDTATDGGASKFYEGLGFNFAGEIPNYAYKPHGGLTGTKFYWKKIGGG